MKRKKESRPVLTATLGMAPYAPICIEYETLQDLMQSVWEIVYDLLEDTDFSLTLHDGSIFPWNSSFATMCFDQGLIQIDEFIDFCRQEHEIEKEQAKSFTATVQISEKNNIKVEYSTLEDLVESIWECLSEITDKDFDYDFEITATLANGSVFYWNHGNAHYCFAKSRISIEQFIDSCNKVVEKKEGAIL
ncbi:MAG: hypothetical protein ACK5HZ_12285 [Macellibacteroides fermentans]|uniref:hypothetical protein n=1 Tax=Macellibacteroides fermentans TaxID=879969 RepID=UPI003AD2C40C